MTYYNTTSLAGESLLSAVEKAKTQDEAILAIYNQGGNWTPWGIHRYCEQAGRNWLIGSVRRSINTLEKKGWLVNTNRQQMGPQGRPEYIWSRS